MEQATTNSYDKIAAAIIQVMKKVEGIEKNMTVGTGNSSYKGVSDKDVKNKVGDAMAEAGLCIVPVKVTPKATVNRWESNGMPKQSVFTEVITEYLLIHTSGQSLPLQGYGHGNDSQDKSAGKATTYALKYTLLYLFMVPTGTLEDADKTHSDALPVPPDPVLEKLKKDIEEADTLEQLRTIFTSASPDHQKATKALKDKMKTKLTPAK